MCLAGFSISGQTFYTKYHNEFGIRENAKNIFLNGDTLIVVGGGATNPDVFTNNDKPIIHLFQLDNGKFINSTHYFLEDSLISYGVKSSFLSKDNLFICGTVTPDTVSSLLYRDLFLMKQNINSDNTRIIKIGMPSSLESLLDLHVDKNNHIYCIGSFESEEEGNDKRKTVIRKFDSDLNQLWVTELGSEERDYRSRSITIDSSSFVYALYSGIFGFTELAKISPIGDTLWTKKYESSSTVVSYQVESSPDGGVLIYEWVAIESLGVSHLVPQFLKLDTEGNVLWRRHYHNNVGRVGSWSQFRVLPDGSFIVAFFQGEEQLRVMKCNADGDVITTFPITGGANFLYPADILAMDDGGYVIVGQLLYDFEPNGETTYIIRTDSLGNFDFTNTTENLIVNNTNILSIFPNPCLDLITVDINLDIKISQLLLSNNKGIIVQDLQMGQNDLSHLPAGVYHVIAIRGNQIIDTEKLLKQ